MRRNLINARHRRGLTQTELAQAVGAKSPGTISMLESGTSRPSWVLANKLADFFETTVDELFMTDEDAVIQIIIDRGYDNAAVQQKLEEVAKDDLPSAEGPEAAVRFAENVLEVKPGGQWCPDCKLGGESDTNREGKCDRCGAHLEPV